MFLLVKYETNILQVKSFIDFSILLSVIWVKEGMLLLKYKIKMYANHFEAV